MRFIQTRWRVSLRLACLFSMSQIVPQLSYPGGCSAFFTDLHLDFSRWLRLVALVPLVHASIEGIYYEELCSHLLDFLPSSNPSNILAVSVERMRSSVFEMLFEEPFFVVRLFHTGIRSVAPLTPCRRHSAHSRTANHYYQPPAGFMNLPSIPNLLAFRLPSVSYVAYTCIPPGRPMTSSPELHVLRTPGRRLSPPQLSWEHVGNEIASRRGMMYLALGPHAALLYPPFVFLFPCLSGHLSLP
jgi:hypothetical protein